MPFSPAPVNENQEYPQEGTGKGLTQKARRECDFPQRHRIAGNAAIVAPGQKGNAVQKACRKGTAEKGFPQRHQITGNAAVVASGQKGNAVQKACRKGTAEKGTPQRHRIAGNAAFVAPGQKGNAVQKACRKGAAEKGFPQRHRIAGNAAVVANQAGRQQQSRLFRLFKVLRSAENGVDGPVDAHAVGIDHQVVLADVGPLAAGVAAVVVGTAGIDPLDFPCSLFRT